MGDGVEPGYDPLGYLFDYIRYAGSDFCLCHHCQDEFARQYGFEPLSSQAAERFPMVASVSANPVVEPTTAVVAAEFSSGVPAIAVNALGQGNVLCPKKGLPNCHRPPRWCSPPSTTSPTT
jgi:hypothetical protein